MKFLAVICFLCTALTLSADAVLVIKGKGRRSAIKVEQRTGIPCRVARYNRNTEVAIRPRKDFQNVKITFKVTNDDDLSFTFGGGYTRTDGNKKNDFEWIDCSLLKIDGQELIGPNAGKDGKKEESFSRPKALKAQVKVKRGGKFTVELTLRATPKKEVCTSTLMKTPLISTVKTKRLMNGKLTPIATVSWWTFLQSVSFPRQTKQSINTSAPPKR